MSTVATSLWFDNQAEEAAEFYTSVIKNSRVHDVIRLPDGSVLLVAFELDGQQFTALNGGPAFSFTEAVSVTVTCESQEEVDELWARLTEGGEEGQCGWLKDSYGLSWQVVPAALPALLRDSDPEKAQRVGQALRGMTKLDIKALQDA